MWAYYSYIHTNYNGQSSCWTPVSRSFSDVWLNSLNQMDASGQDDGLAQDLQITPENSDVDESGTSFTILIFQFVRVICEIILENWASSRYRITDDNLFLIIRQFQTPVIWL